MTSRNVNLNILFNPKSIAVIGAIDDEEKVGGILSKNIEQSRRIFYPVNPAFKKVLGQRCYKSVKEISGPVDLAVIAVKPEIVPIVLKECGEKGISFVVIITAGFKETGEDGKKREDELIALAKKYKIKLLGPNCLGVMDVNANFNATFADLPKIKGKIAFVSQSGAAGTALMNWAEKEGVGFSKFISLGNEAGLTENDFLEYLADDSETEAALIYLEGVSDGSRFVKALSVLASKKPVVVLKAGRTERGAAAVSSHTGSLTPAYEIFKTACRQSKALVVESLGEMLEMAKLLAAGFGRQTPNEWVIVTNGGGPSIVAADLIEASSNLRLAEISESVKIALGRVLPPAASVHNPVDLIGDALADRYQAALKILSVDKNIGGILVILTPQKMTEVEKTAEVLVSFKKKKPIIPMFIGGEAVAEGEKILRRGGLGNFPDAGALVRALSALAPGRTFSPSEKKSVAVESRQLPFTQTVALLNEVGLNCRGLLIKSRSELKNKLIGFPWPAAMKIVSEQVIHKSDAGAVKINLTDLSAAEAAWDEISANISQRVPEAEIEGMLVQPMVFGREALIGLKRDATFGPVVVFGLGGIFTEILKDVSRRLPPLDEAEALAMIEEIKGVEILRGARGQKPVDLRALAKIIVALGRLGLVHPEIKEIDLNPVMASEKGAEIVDCRILV